MFCEQCGNVMSDNAKFCGKCGHKVEETKLTCHECGAEYESGQIYCEQCGVKLKDVTAGSVTENVIENNANSNMPVTPPYVASFRTSGDMSQDVVSLSALAKGELSYTQIQRIVSNIYSGHAPMEGVGNVTPPQVKSPQFDIRSFKISGSKVEDINRLRRDSGGMSLKEAKDIIDRMYATQSTASATVPQNQNNRVKADPNQMICQSPTVTWYKGDKALGSSSVNGILKLYGDRVEFLTTFKGLSLFSAPPSRMYFYNIAEVSKGRYMMGSSILITMKDGEKHTFAALSNKLYDFLDQVINYRGKR